MKRILFLFAFTALLSCNNSNPNIEAVKEAFRKEGANDEALNTLEYYSEKESKSIALQKITERYTKSIIELKQFDPVNRTTYFLTKKIDSVKAVFDTIKLDSIDKVKVVKKLDKQYIHKNYYLVNGKIIDHSEGYGK